ncbi:unnamed protein product [Ceutorhynchus assimilis]|uniref:DUF4817 domain-containing protein n=1 Tax=Ceutorhynchus assimilis TaxID=467358 RepID=A0A9P0DVH0_9CUCU|nr:unnamed protein product [Ceutorhynchus assimilis]
MIISCVQSDCNKTKIYKMARVREGDRIEILMMIGYGNRMRTQKEFCESFNNKYPRREPISQFNVSKIEKKNIGFWVMSGIIKIYKKGGPRISKVKQLNIILAVQEDYHKKNRDSASYNQICQSSDFKYLILNKWHPYKVLLLHELNEDEVTHMNLCNNNPQIIKRIVFSDVATFCPNGRGLPSCIQALMVVCEWLVRVKTKNGFLKHTLVKLCLLPLDICDESD